MNVRERLMATINRQPVDRLPVDLWHTPEIGEALRRHTHTDNNLDMYRALALDKIVWVFVDYHFPGGEDTSSQVGDRQSIRHPHHVGRSPPRYRLGPIPLRGIRRTPMKNFQTLAEVERYPWWPNPDNFDYAGATQRAKRPTGTSASSARGSPSSKSTANSAASNKP